MEQGWKEYFVFTKRERWAILLLFGLIALIWCMHWLNPVKTTPLKITWTSLDSIHQKMEGIERGKSSYDAFKKEEVRNDNVRLFPFDPNTASKEEWKVLGLTDKQAGIIHNYISKGGRFRKAEDLLKIYGLRREDAERLMPFVQIKQADRPPSYKENSDNGFQDRKDNKKDTGNKNYKRFPEEEKQFYANQRSFSPGSGNYNKSNTIIEINTAGMEEFESLPGIGNKLAERIIKYRDKLGGFYAVSQVAETFGIQDSVFQKFKEQLKCDGNIRKVSINLVSSNELFQHPYFRGKLATLLVNYRQEHGPFTTMEDLSRIPMMNDQLLGKIRPYISLEEKK
jgi:competence ComEA-like helix-hairpin-helix protein